MRGALLLVALLVAVPAAAHRGHDALTVVIVAPSGMVTVSHRFEASDVEPALAEIAPQAQPSLDDPAAIAALVAYLKARFTLATERGPLALTAGPAEIGSAEVRIDFTAKAAAPIRRLTIGSRLLTDIYPRQVNQVNVQVGNTVRTLTFTGGDTQTIELR